MEGRTERSRTKKASETAKEGSLRVWGEVGVTICLTNDPPQFLRVLFGHERLTTGTTATALKNATAEIEEYNERQLQRHVKSARRIALKSMSEADEEEEDANLTTRERARRRAGKRR